MYSRDASCIVEYVRTLPFKSTMFLGTNLCELYDLLIIIVNIFLH